MQKHHRQGLAAPGKNLKSYGLFFEEELVAVALFCNPRTKKKQREYTTELFRLAFKTETRVIGGASKLIKHFMQSGAWDLFTYQDTSGEGSEVYAHAGMELKGNKSPRKNILVKNGLTSIEAEDNRSDWFSLEQVFTHGPDKLIGTKLGEQFKENGARKNNLELFLESGYHLEEIDGDRLYEWRNPEVGFYTYKISSIVDNKYYYGRHVLYGSLNKENALSDKYMGSGGKKFQAWVKSVGVDNLRKTVLDLYPDWKSVVKAEEKLIGNLHLTDKKCMNFQPGGTGIARASAIILEKECHIHGFTNHQGDSCMKCASAKSFFVKECDLHGTSIFHGNKCSLCISKSSVTLKHCEFHGETKHNGDSCFRCTVEKAWSLKNCVTHGETLHRGESCEKCNQLKQYDKAVCVKHGLSTHRAGSCVSCQIDGLMSEKNCPTHGFVIHFGDTCSTCTSQKSVSRKNCEIHGMVTHQGDVCSTCNSLKALTIQTCSIHGETKYLGSHCMKCNAADQLTEKTCKKHGVVLHKGDSCTFCTAQKSVNMKLCETHPVEHGVTKHQGDVCNKCNALNSVSMKECLKHGLTKHQGNVCNKCNSQKSVVLGDCTVHGNNVKFQGGKCSSCTNASLIKVKECAVHGMWKHRGNSCYACVSDRRKAATATRKAAVK